MRSCRWSFSANLVSSHVSEAFFGGLDSNNIPFQSFTTPVAGLPSGLTAPRPRTELRELFEWNGITGI